MDFLLSEEQQLLQNSALEFSKQRLWPHAEKWDQEHIFPIDVIRDAGNMGFMSLYVPEDFGGLGLSRLDASVIFEQLAMGCTTTTAYVTIHNMVSWMVASYGSKTTKEKWCSKLATGEKLASYCLTEPQAGSDAASIQTKAVKKSDHYVINGSKCFISGAGSTDLLLVMARTGDDSTKGISAFVVPANAKGIGYGRPEKKMGWNSQPTRTITFSDVEISRDNLLAAEGDGFKIAMQALDGGRINIATCSVGTAQRALNEAKAYMKERRQFNRPLTHFQGLQFKFADMATELIAARQMVRLAAFHLDLKDDDATTYCAMAKRFATDVGFKVCNEALQIFGGYGYIKDYPLERFVRDTRVHQILEGTNEIMRLIISKKMLGI